MDARLIILLARLAYVIGILLGLRAGIEPELMLPLLAIAIMPEVSLISLLVLERLTKDQEAEAATS